MITGIMCRKKSTTNLDGYGPNPDTDFLDMLPTTGSKFAHLWCEKTPTSESGTASGGGESGYVDDTDDSTRLSTDLLKTLEHDPIPSTFSSFEYSPTRRENGSSIESSPACQGLFESFGFGTNFDVMGQFDVSGTPQTDGSVTSSPSAPSDSVGIPGSASSQDTSYRCFNYTVENIVQSLRYIASRLEMMDEEKARTPVREKDFWLSNAQVPTNTEGEQLSKWMTHLRDIQDFLAKTTEIESLPKAQLCDVTCALEKHLLFCMMGSNTPKFTAAGECSVETQLQAQRFLRSFRSASSPKSTHVWKGTLPRRDYLNAVFSCKVFLGGLPYDMTEAGMMQAFKPFGNVKVEWPGKEVNPVQHKGYAYIIFENEGQVKTMLQNCTCDYLQDGKWFCKMSSRKVPLKDVEVIPWTIADTNFAVRQTSKLESRLTIFVGALHGMLNAQGLALVMEDLFGGVIHAGIDTDRNKYPIGSGRVTFDNFRSYFAAINGGFVEIKSSKFKKTVQVDPYLEDSTCSCCCLQQAPYFCRHLECFRYYCRTCFEASHVTDDFKSHRPLMRNPNRKLHSNLFGCSSPTNPSVSVGLPSFNGITSPPFSTSPLPFGRNTISNVGQINSTLMNRTIYRQPARQYY